MTVLDLAPLFHGLELVVLLVLFVAVAFALATSCLLA